MIPSGPYSLGGWSLGGNIALEMASILCESDEIVNKVILWDSFHHTGFVHLTRSTTHSLTNNGLNNLPNCLISEVNVEHAEVALRL